MIVGLRLPFLTERDPPLAGEGILDPLGLATLGDRLADEIAPGMTARMYRPRFLTAMAVVSSLTEDLEDRLASDEVTPPYLVFEWFVVEAFARMKLSTRRVSGMDKARAAVARGGSLDARSYLKTPKVFGFHGIYRRLAVALGIVDRDGVVTTLGQTLVRAWERELGLTGFLERTSGTPGGDLARDLRGALDRALDAARVTIPPRSRLWPKLAVIFDPDHPSSSERALLRGAMLAPERGAGAELFASVERHTSGAEWEVLAAVRALPTTSAELRARIDAIFIFEEFARELYRAFDLMRWCSTAQGGPITRTTLAADERMRVVARELPMRTRRTLAALEPFGLGQPFELSFGSFGDLSTVPELFDELLRHHERIQQSKPPAGKRSWFEHAGSGVIVRPAYRVPAALEYGEFIHPFRVHSMQWFWQDLR